MSDLQKLQKNWEGFAQTDALWAICTDPSKKDNQWDEAEFFATGRQEIATVLDYLGSQGIAVNTGAPALDFGCGVGRLTQALAERFDECVGVDISPTMVEMAEKFNKYADHCRYLVNDSAQLPAFLDNHFGFIYTSIVLQHMDTKFSKQYLREFLRVLQPGGILVFQVPDRLIPPTPPPGAVPSTPREKLFMLYVVLRRKLNLKQRVLKLLGRPTPQPAQEAREEYLMEMHCIPEEDVRKLYAAMGAKVLDVKLTNSTQPDFNGVLRYLDREPAEGYVSKQYCVAKER